MLQPQIYLENSNDIDDIFLVRSDRLLFPKTDQIKIANNA